MNLPNKITLFRIVLIIPFMLFLNNGQKISIIPLVIFIVAALTDTLDGYIARTYHMVTDFGKFADPLADKLLVTAAILSFVDFGIMPSWIALLILAREFMITALRTIAMGKGRVIAASLWGKIKTIIQFTGIAVLLLISSAPFAFLYSQLAVNIINYAMVIVTLLSGIDYLVKNKDLISETK